MIAPVAAAVAFVALGANLIGAAALLVFNPRSRAVRWFVAFEIGLMVWLFSQGVIALGGDQATWLVPMAIAVTALPGLSVAATLMEDPTRPLRHGLLVLVVTVAFMPIGIAEFAGRGGFLLGLLYAAWHVVGWSVSSMIHFRRRNPRKNVAGLNRVVTVTLLGSAPAVVAAGFLLGMDAFFVYVIPLMTVLVQVLILMGVATMRFYDIEVRVARTGELAAQAVRTERLAVLGELAATVAHEVRNPLTGMRSLAQRLAEEDVDDERRRRYATVILEETGRVERIVANLLGLARGAPRHAGAKGPTSLDALFGDLELLTRARAEGRGVRLRFSGHGVVTDAPREQLAQALLNLLLNAIDHSPEGGTVDVTGSATKGGVELIVRDQGPGVPPDARTRIFEAFSTAEGDGSGLGLSVVRSLAREFGWAVEVADAPGGGAEFRIRIPGVARPAGAVPAAAHA